jgi:DNA-damage-inducible protein J
MGHHFDVTLEDSIMRRTATVRARVAPSLKADVEKLLDRLGMTATEAITLFYHQIRLHKGFPFSVDLPNAITRKTFEATDRGEGLNTYDSIDKMFAALDKC